MHLLMCTRDRTTGCRNTIEKSNVFNRVYLLQERDIAADMIRRGYMKKTSCRDISHNTEHFTYKVNINRFGHE